MPSRPCSIYSAFFIAVFSICGCSSQASKAPVVPSTLRTISINTNVRMTDSPDFKSGSAKVAGALMGPLVGAAIRGATSNADALKILAEGDAINLKQLVLDTFKEQLTAAGIPVKIAENNAEADLHIEIDEYGLGAVDLQNMRPFLSIEASLIDLKGKEIWHDSEGVDEGDSENNANALPWQRYATQPELLKADFATLSNFAVKSVVDDLIHCHATGDIGE